MIDGKQSSHRFRLAWMRWRNRLIGDPAFQRRAMRNPLLRFTARRHARRLFDLTAGFVYSQIAAATVESGLLEAVAARPLSLAEAATASGLSEQAARTLLLAAASLGLVEEVGQRWTLGQSGAALLATPGLGAMIRHHQLFYRDLADPLALLRSDSETGLSRLWDYAPGTDPDDARAYSELMSATQPLIAEQALAAYSFGRHHALLDIGGGQGRFLRAVGDKHSTLRLGLFDRPEVLTSLGNEDSIARHAGDFLRDPLPRGYDLHSLVRVLHDHDDQPAMRLLKASRAALEKGGRLIIVEPMATGGSAPEGHAYFGLYLTAMRSGRPRTPSEISDMLKAAGFRRTHRRATPLPLAAGCIIADA